MTVIDARFAAQDHACRGTWDVLGTNAGGHTVQLCGPGLGGCGTLLIEPHPDPGHQCDDPPTGIGNCARTKPASPKG